MHYICKRCIERTMKCERIEEGSGPISGNGEEKAEEAAKSALADANIRAL